MERNNKYAVQATILALWMDFFFGMKPGWIFMTDSEKLPSQNQSVWGLWAHATLKSL